MNLPTGATVTTEHLHNISLLLAAADSSKRNSVTAFFGLFSLVNILWLAGISGVCITLGPTACILFSPIVILVFELFERYSDLLRAVANRLKPLLPIMYFVCCFYLVAAAGSYSPAAATYVALTGQGLAVVLVAYESAIIFELILCQELEGSHRYDVEQQMAFMLHTTSDQSFILMLLNNSIPYYCWQPKHRN